MNRGISRRTMFERVEDVAFFLNLLMEAVLRGEIEVHAFCILTTHFHILVRSLRGELAVAMQRVQTEYSRWFNRSRRRDGPLVRGRYASKRVVSDFYRRTVVRYIDANPVQAGLVLRSADFPHGSARAYELGPPDLWPWLERSWVEGEVCRILGLAAYEPARYAEVFERLPKELAWVVEARWRSAGEEDPLDDLIDAAPEAVLDWMRRKAALADGTRPALAVLDPVRLDAALEGLPERGEAWRLHRRDGWAVLRVGLARQLCGLRLDELAERAGCSRSAAGDTARLHGRLLQADEEYARRAAAVATRALEAWR
jgi:hypothetical protein